MENTESYYGLRFESESGSPFHSQLFSFVIQFIGNKLQKPTSEYMITQKLDQFSFFDFKLQNIDK